jgi:hypothetical protein
MRRSDASEAVGFGFHHCFERIMPKHTLLLEVSADGVKFVIRQGLTQ